MILHRKGSRWALNPFKVKYTQHGEELEKYDHDKEWWLGFEKRWDHTEIIEFVDVEYTEEQKSRLKEIEYLPEDFGHIYSEYVKTGEFIVDVIPPDHPFNLIRLREENKALQTVLSLSTMETYSTISGVSMQNEVSQAAMLMEILTMIENLQGGN